jgi:hypothetical protein
MTIEHKTVERQGLRVVRLNLELVAALVTRLDEYCEIYGRTKRDVIGEAVTLYLNKRESGEW